MARRRVRYEWFTHSNRRRQYPGLIRDGTDGRRSYFSRSFIGWLACRKRSRVVIDFEDCRYGERATILSITGTGVLKRQMFEWSHEFLSRNCDWKLRERNAPIA